MSDYPALHIKRTFNAPIQAVWDAWTQPEMFKQWYMPLPFTVPDCEFNMQVGGQLKIDTKAPDGSIMTIHGEFKVIDRPTRLTMTNYPLDENGDKLFEILHSLELSEVDNQTILELTSEVVYAQPDSKQFIDGMEEGLNQALDQLGSVVTAS